MHLSGTVAESKMQFYKLSTEAGKSEWVMRKVKLGDSVTQKLGKVHSLQKEDQNVFCLAPSPLLF